VLTCASTDDGGARWTARLDGAPGCVGEGDDPAEAIAAAEAVALRLLEEARAAGRAAVEPAAFTSSGRLLLRMPKTLHAELSARADAEGTSLNRLIVRALAASVADRETVPPVGDPLPAVQSRLPRAVRLSLAVNAAVAALAAAAAVLILAGVWHPGL